MGTYELMNALSKHWQHPSSPIYQADVRYGPPWRALELHRWLGRVLRLLAMLIAAIIVVTLGKALTNQVLLAALSNVLIQTVCLGAGGLLLIALIALTFLWPIGVALAASDTIVRDRERRTWAPLLVTPIAWSDLLTAKLASALSWFNRPFSFLMWLQGVLLLVVFILVIGQIEHISSAYPPFLVMVLAFVASAEFFIERVQDYAAASIIGLAASVHAESRQAASMAALLGGITLVLMRLLLTALTMVFWDLPSPQALTLFFATGPTVGIALAVPLPIALVVLITIPLLREWAIRRGYHWVLGHLNTAVGNG